MRRLVMVVVMLAGCGKSDCQRAVHHVMDLTAHAGPTGSEPKADEQAVIDRIEQVTIAACEREGLSAEQRDCILAMKTFGDMDSVTKCPAIVAKRPTWLIAP